MKKKGTTNSKYIGQVFQGWKVDWAERVDGGHQRFYLTKIAKYANSYSKLVISVRDNMLTKLSRNELSMHELLHNKAVLAAKGICSYQNSVHNYAR